MSPGTLHDPAAGVKHQRQAGARRSGLRGHRPHAWVERFPPLWQAAWQDPLRVDPARYAAAKNGRDLLAALLLQIDQAAPFPAAGKVRAALAIALKRM